MKIAFDLKNCFLYGRGITTFIVNFLSDYKQAFKSSNQDFLLAPEFDFLNSVNQGLFNQFKRINTHAINKNNKISKILYDQIYIKNALYDLKPDLFFSPYFDIPYFYNGIKVTTIHDLSIFNLKYLYSYMYYNYYSILLKKSITSSHKILTVSNFSKFELLNNFSYLDENKVIVFYNKSNPSILNYSLDTDTYYNQYIEEYNVFKLPKNFILYTGGFEKRKNIDLLLNGFFKAKSLCPSIPPLVLTGVTNKIFLDYNLKRFTSKNLFFIDYVSDTLLPMLYAHADLIVNTSQYEGFGIPILDAMTMKKPILCSDIPVYKEIGEDLPIYFQNNNINDFVDKLIVFFNNKFSFPNLENYYERSKFFNYINNQDKIINIFNLKA